MKIEFLIKHFHDAKGGAEKVLAMVANHLVHREHDVTIVCYDAEPIEPFFGVDKRVHLVGLGSKSAQPKTSLIDLVARTLKYRSHVKQSKPDVVIGFMMSAMPIAVFSTIGTKIRVIGSEHIGRTHYARRPFEYLLLLTCVWLSERTSVISESIKLKFPKFLHRRLVTISNPIERPRIVRSPRVSGKRIAINVARLEHQKNHETLVRAWQLIAKQFPDWELHIYGEGSLRTKIERLIHEYKLEQVVHLKGTTKNVEEKLAAADLFVFPSRYESFGLSLAEALSVGLPSVGFAGVDGVCDLIQHNINGLLINSHVNDEMALAHNLAHLMGDDSFREKLSTNAQVSIEKFFADAIFEKWNQLLVPGPGETTNA